MYPIFVRETKKKNKQRGAYIIVPKETLCFNYVSKE